MATTETAPVTLRCPNRVCDRPMEQRPAHLQTPEQAFCGTWWDCPRCRTAVLFPSPALEAQLREQRKALAARAAEQPDIRAGFDAWLSNACYFDGRNYRLKRDRSRIAPWNKAIKRAYPSCDDLHEAAHLYEETIHA